MVHQEENRGQWRKNAPNFPGVTVPIFPIFPEGLMGIRKFPLIASLKDGVLTCGLDKWGKSKASVGPRKIGHRNRGLGCCGGLPWLVHD